jgi:iron complex outermembrane receptor protein
MSILRVFSLSTAFALTGTLLSPVSFAQRTDDNVTAQSDDAFGRSVGNESIGIYNVGEVRGFSPIAAGNVRIEGLYFDRQTDPNGRLVDGASIRVGIASQSYPFPSPTGIVDYDLRTVGATRVISPVLSYGPWNGRAIQIDAQLPLAGETLGVALGGSVERTGFGWGGQNHSRSLAIMPSWRPTPNIELRPFYSRIDYRSEEPQSYMLTADGDVPPKYPRHHYYGQKWAMNEGRTLTYGFLGSARVSAWTVRLGLFESAYIPDFEFADLYTGLDPAGRGDEDIVAFQQSRFGSKSGELRATRTFDEGDRRHTLLFTVRGRLQERRYGGEDVIHIDDVELGVGRLIPQPTFEFGPQTSDEVKQETAGALYGLRWKDRGELSVGVQKTHYSKSIDTPEGPLPESRAHPLLKYATATVYAGDRLAIYGSYTEGLEESPVAPSNATNRNEAAPALMTKQYDAGVRLDVTTSLKLIAGVFNVEKPYFDLDTTGRFTSLGTVRHRGIELSLSGAPTDDLTVVAGTRFLDATVSGPLVDAAIIGNRPVASYKNYSMVNVNYVFAGTPFSLDAWVESVSRQMATTSNSHESPGRVVAHLGGRYKFKLLDKPAMLRVQVNNIFDRYGWSVISGGAYVYNQPRRITVTFATDL